MLLVERADDRAAEAPRSVDVRFWAVVAVCATLLMSAVTTSSLWIDEGFIAWVASHGSLASLVETLRGPLPSPADRQYPLYDLWILGWTHVFGFSEYALRAANLPFAALYVVALATGSRFVSSRRFAWVPFSFIPFMWFYVNEARSYCMLAAFSTVAVAAVAAYAFGPPRTASKAPWIALPAVLLASLSNILALFVMPGLIVIALAGRNRTRAVHWSAWRGALALWGLPLVATAAFYVATLTGGGGSAEVASNQHRISSIAGAAQVLYEQFGFAGLGPPRNDLRAASAVTNWLHYAPWLAFGLLGLAIGIYPALKRKPDARALWTTFAWALCYAVAVGLSSVFHARFLGRHLAAIVPLFAFAGTALLRSPLAILAIAAVFALSDARLSLLSQYWKDDYRGAIANLCTRNAASPGTIFWAADTYTAQYYGLELSNSDIADTRIHPPCARGTLVASLAAHDAEAMLGAQAMAGRRVYLALSKPDLFDTRGGWAAVLEQRAAKPIARYRTFEIYEFPPLARRSLTTTAKP